MQGREILLALQADHSKFIQGFGYQKSTILT